MSTRLAPPIRLFVWRFVDGRFRPAIPAAEHGIICDMASPCFGADTGWAFALWVLELQDEKASLADPWHYCLPPYCPRRLLLGVPPDGFNVRLPFSVAFDATGGRSACRCARDAPRGLRADRRAAGRYIAQGRRDAVPERAANPRRVGDDAQPAAVLFGAGLHGAADRRVARSQRRTDDQPGLP